MKKKVILALTVLLMTGKNKCYNQREGERGDMVEYR
jgi:hypothetical protein